MPVPDLAEVGVEHHLEHGVDLGLAEPGQLGTFGVRRMHQGDPDILGQRSVVGRLTIGVAVRDLDREGAQFLVPGAGGLNDDARQQVGLFGVRREAEPGAVTEGLGRAPEVEGGGPGRNPHRPAGEILGGQGA